MESERIYTTRYLLQQSTLGLHVSYYFYHYLKRRGKFTNLFIHLCFENHICCSK